MFRISDIFKKHHNAPPPPESAADLPPKKRPEEVILMGSQEAAASVKEHYHSTIEKTITTDAKAMISSAINKELKKDAEADAARHYVEIFTAVQHIYTIDLKTDPDFLSLINALTEKTVTMLIDHHKSVEAQCLLDYPSIDDYLYYHIVNVYFLSLDVGLELGYDRPRLIDLGAGAFLHDIGLKGIREHKNGEKLDNRGYDKIRQHPVIGADILTKAAKDIKDEVIKIVKQEHERIDGSGYPEGLPAEDITTFAQVVGLVDVYEALTHKRPYRGRFTPIEALDIILKNKNVFGPRIIKTLISRIGVYPVGTLVLLNSKETAVVIMNRPELPFRPVVSVIYDPYGETFPQPKEIDLANTPILYIEDCVKERV